MPTLASLASRYTFFLVLALSQCSSAAFSTRNPAVLRTRFSGKGCESLSQPLSRQTPSRCASHQAKAVVDETSATTKSSPKEIIVSTSLQMPFSATTAFDAFSDLPRQSEFSPWLKSVEYLTPPAEGFDRVGQHLGETKWTMGYKGVSFSWNAISTRLERPHTIEWKSTSGIRNFGRVDFQPLDEDKTHMTLTMTFVAPRIIAALFRRSSSMATFVQNQILHTTLTNFRDTVVNVDLASK